MLLKPKEFDAEAFAKEATNITLSERTMEMVDNFGQVHSPEILPIWKDFYEKMLAEKGKGNKRKSADFTIPFNGLRIPRHPATQSALIWPGIPRPSGHLFHGHPAGQSER
ncbi:hypothetical protein ACSETL_36255, partial [Pseudomonas aeruginosa]